MDQNYGQIAPVFTVRPLNSEMDPSGRWGYPADIGFRFDCSLCEDFETGASADIGDMLRGHVRWHRAHVADAAP